MVDVAVVAVVNVVLAGSSVCDNDNDDDDDTEVGEQGDSDE
jgi:hypothetical protein